MSITNRVQAAAETIRTRREERLALASEVQAQQGAIDTIPNLLNRSMVLAAGDAAAARIFATQIAGAVSALEAKEWAVNLTTQPGDVVWNPDKTARYIYSGKDPMTHANPLFFPGSTGVYYWAIIPDLLNGVKVFPNVSGIVVFVAKGDVWYNPGRTKMYTWTGDDYHCPSGQYPGAAGVHSWVAE